MHKFLIHNEGDDVGIATEDINRGDQVTGVYMDTEETITLQARGDIPLGHKIALAAVGAGQQVIKYNVPIGNATQDIGVGEHVHTHCLKTARWQV